MLIIARRKDESVIINGNITIMVTHIEKGLVKLGITAPADVEVWREEIAEAVARNGRRPSKACPDVDPKEGM